jgi:hypothetical protein
MKFRFKLAAGASILIFLTGITHVCHAGQGSAGDGTSAVSELLRLLQAKGVVTSEEAGELEKKFDHGSPGSDKTKDKRFSTPAGNTAKATVSASTGDKVMDTIASLAGQNVISSEEKAELTGRADVLNSRRLGKSVPDRQQHEVGAEVIDYGKTTVSVEEIRDQLRFLAYRKVMTRDEAAKVYERFGGNYTAALNKDREETTGKTETKPVDIVTASAEMQDAYSVASANREMETAAVPFAYGEIIETLDSIADQGIISEEEKDELKERADAMNREKRGEKVPARKHLSVGKSRLDYRQTTIPVDDVEDDLRFLAYQKVMTRAEASAAFARFGRKYPTDQMAENITDELGWDVRNQVDQKMQIVSELERRVGKMPEWIQRFKLAGDLRLRYEGDYYANDNGDFLNPSNPTVLLNSHTDQSLYKLRARLGIFTKVTDGVDAGLGLATGTTNNPVSTNVTLGDFFNKKSITLDLAYLKWNPVPSITLWGGIFPNPWFSTDMVWDRDINFTGLDVQYDPQLTESLGMFFSAGAFPLQVVDQHQKWLFGGQLGTQVKPVDKLTAKLGVAFYDFVNTVGVLNNDPVQQPGATDWSVPLFQQKGNTLMDINSFDTSTTHVVKTAYASEFKELNITGSVDAGFWDPVHVIFTADYVKNLGFNSHDVELRALPEFEHVRKEAEGFQLGLTVGYPIVRNFGEWQGFFSYKYLGSDAVIDAFTDSDFHLGGTNAKGWIIGGEFGLAGNVWLTTRWLSSNEISGPPFGIDVFQFDLNAKF